MSHLIENKVLMWWMVAPGPKLLSCWCCWPPSTIKVTLQKWQHEIVWPKYRTKWQENVIGPQSGFIPSELKPCYRQFGVDRCTYWESDIAVEKLRRTWKFWFYFSLCENTMGSNDKLNNQHIQFHSSIHTLVGLNENQCPRVRFQQLLYLIWFWRLSRHWKCHGRSIKTNQNSRLPGIWTTGEVHRLLQYCSSHEISKGVMYLSSACCRSSAISTSRTAIVTMSDCRILGGLGRFATVSQPAPTIQPHHRPMLSSERSSTSSNDGSLSSTRCLRYFSLWL